MGVLVAACGGGGGDASSGSRTQPPPSLAALAVKPSAPWKDGVVRFSTQCTGSGTLRYEWDMGDAPSGQGKTPVQTSAPTIDYTYSAPGSYTVRVTCIDSSAQTGTVQATVSVGSLNLDSVADRVCSSTQLGHGWCVQNPLPTSNQLNSVAQIARATVWAVGDSGSIVKTVDGGVSWTAQYAGVTFDLRSISAVDASVAWAVGNSGALLKTTDGGDTWQIMQSPSGGDWQRVFALDAQTIWAANTLDVFRSTDGGAHWTTVRSGAIGSLSVDRTGVAWTVDDGTVYRSADSGATWAKTTHPPMLAVSFVEAVAPNGAWAMSSSGQPFVTADGGQSWKAATALALAPTDAVTALSAVDLENVWVLSHLTVWTTHDRGATWGRGMLNPPGVEAIATSGITDAWVVGDLGSLSQTRDAGASWTTYSSGTTRILLDVAAADEQAAWVLANSRGLLKTTDGGRVWQVQALPDWATNVRAVDRNTAWAVGFDGELMYTQDGDTWFSVMSSPVMAMVAPLSHDLLWGLGNAGVLRSGDGGFSWTALGRPVADTLTDIAPVSTTAAWLGTRTQQLPSAPDPRIGRLLKTMDGGATWVTQVDSTVHSFDKLAAIDANTAWALAHTNIQAVSALTNSAIYRTVDGGAHWTAVWTLPFDTGFLNALTAQDALRAQAIGQDGQIYATQDGGATWSLQAKHFSNSNLNAMAWVRPSPGGTQATTAWIVGADGLILKTLTGGQ